MFNQYVTNCLSHPYLLDESNFIFRDIRCDFLFLFHFSMKFLQANRIAPDGTLRFAASQLGLFCLSMFHKKGHNAYMSSIVGKTGFCICENKDADQLRGNREADQRLCFALRG